jgi:hypothetical protein
LPVLAIEGVTSESGEVQVSNSGEEGVVARCEQDHDHNQNLEHHHEHYLHRKQHHNHDHHMFNGDFGSSQPAETVLSPAPISPKTMVNKSATNYSQDGIASDTRETTVVPNETHASECQDLKPAPLNFEKRIKTEAASSQIQEDFKVDVTSAQMNITDNARVTVSCSDLIASKFAFENPKSELHVQTQDFSANAPPSPELTPISTPQLSETSLSTPQMDTPSHASMPLVGLGVQGLHIMTGIPENSAHDLSFDDLNHLEQLYGGGASSNGRLVDNYSCDNAQSLSDTIRDNHDVSYSNTEPIDIPLPLSATENVCMSSEFDMASTYPEHSSHEMRSMTDFPDDVLGLHMDMRIALDHGNSHFSSMNGTNLLDPYGGMI